MNEVSKPEVPDRIFKCKMQFTYAFCTTEKQKMYYFPDFSQREMAKLKLIDLKW